MCTFQSINHVRALYRNWALTYAYLLFLSGSLRNLSLQAAAATAKELDGYSEPSLHQLHQAALIHYKKEFNRVLESLGLPASAGVTASAR